MPDAEEISLNLTKGTFKMEMKRLRKFLIITFAITGLAWGLLAVFTKFRIISFTHPVGTVLHMTGGFGPTIAALLVLEEGFSFQAAMKFVFRYKRNTMLSFWTLAAMAIAVISISSMEFNAALPWYLLPVVFLQAVFIYGGEEELGWRGIMQPILEKKLPFPVATVIKFNFRRTVFRKVVILCPNHNYSVQCKVVGR